jgi:hypothetical protein
MAEPENLEITLRPAAEIQRAHDILVAVLLGETPLRPNDRARRYISVACDALCFVLSHEHNTTFAENLQTIEAEIKEAGGGELIDSGKLQRRTSTDGV